MRLVCSLLALALLVPARTALAQDVSTRYKEQHLKQTEEKLVIDLQGKDAELQAQAAQTIRELEWEFPGEPFSTLVDPLMRVIRDEKAGAQVRILAALALDGLHSDIGDAAIKGVAGSSSNKSVQDVCAALLVKGVR